VTSRGSTGTNVSAPPRSGLNEWLVAGALLETAGHLLLVRNERRGGHSDWSTPGGVIDATDDSLLAGLTREVEEETGLRVTSWEGPLYEVRAIAPEMGWVMRAHVYRATAYEGEVRVEDPDGIVVEAEFVSHDRGLELLAQGARWVHEPLAEWINERWGPAEARGYSYEVRGANRGEMHVRGAHWGR
jgi:8-oxo-dGTP diphosphatase